MHHRYWLSLATLRELQLVFQIILEFIGAVSKQLHIVIIFQAATFLVALPQPNHLMPDRITELRILAVYS